LARTLNVLFRNTTQYLKAMITQVKRYLNLKSAATRLMMAGDVDRYMHALRLMSVLRNRGLAVS
jgi:hypothetical protein